MGHDRAEDVERRLLPAPSYYRCVVAPRLKRGRAAIAHGVRGARGKERAVTSASLSRLIRVARTAVPAAVLTAALGLHPTDAHPRRAPSEGARTLVLSDQARRYLMLEYRAYSTEFMGCMIGDQRHGALFVRRIAPADVEPTHSTQSHVVPRQTCEEAGWAGTVGIVHSHPGGERCFYYFPGTQVASSDAQAFARQAYPVDAIMCGDSIVWVNSDLVQRRLALTEHRGGPAPQPGPGNRVHEGSRVAVREN